MDEVSECAEISPSTYTKHISLNINHKCMDILEYIGGRIVQKYSKKYPELEGKPDAKFKWITLKDTGGLSYPSDSLMCEIQEMEKSFRVFHGEKIDMKREPIARLVDIILEKSALQREVIEFFVKVRFFRRIKELNMKPLLLEGRGGGGVRAHKQQAQFRN